MDHRWVLLVYSYDGDILGIDYPERIKTYKDKLGIKPTHVVLHEDDYLNLKFPDTIAGLLVTVTPIIKVLPGFVGIVRL